MKWLLIWLAVGLFSGGMFLRNSSRLNHCDLEDAGPGVPSVGDDDDPLFAPPPTM